MSDSNDFIKQMVDTPADWSPLTISWAAMVGLLVIVSLIMYYRYNSRWSYWRPLVLLGSMASVVAAFYCGGDIFNVDGWLANTLAVIAACVILFSQQRLYGNIIDSFDWSINTDDIVWHLFPISLIAGTIAGVVRAVFGLIGGRVGWIDYVLLVAVAYFAITVMVSAIKSREGAAVLRGLVTALVIAAATFYTMFAIAVMVYYTWGFFLIVLIVLFLPVPSAGGRR